jgi:signal transduction histidine kinase
VLISDSVTGTLVIAFNKDRSVRLCNIDPTSTRYKKLYKAFLAKTIPQSELMVTIVDGKGLVGILNLEHAQPNFFSPASERVVLHAANALAPFVRELNRTFDIDRKRQSANLYAMFGFLQRLSETFQHKTGQLLPSIGKQRRDLKELIEAKKTQEAGAKLEELNHTIDQYAARARLFMGAAPHYISRGSRDLRTLVQRAIEESKVSDASIKYEFKCEEDPKIYASDMFQEHLYNLLNNSVYAIKVKRKNKQPGAGLIRVEAQTEQVTDFFGVATRGERVRIRIIDNGTGVDEDVIDQVGNYSFSTKGAMGSGFGVAAAKEYVKSLGGKLETRNDKDDDEKIQGFVVEMFLEVFDTGRHREEKLGEKR